MDNLELNKLVKADIAKKDELLSVFATKHQNIIRLKEEDNNDDIRFPFFKDTDSIIHSLSYTRYIDKTQVFTNPNNDNISKRVLHVQLVNKIARTIGRALNLNEDLIEAISLGHDIGHVPFGHTGEAILNKLSLKFGEGYFMHNVQSVRNFMVLEKNGKGINLSVQVLDGILCHNGEILSGKYAPINKTKEQFIEDYNNCYIDDKASLRLSPMTLEGCVVRVSDVIAYVGRDFEDAVRLNIITKDDIPLNVANTLGSDNSSIVNSIVLDIIKNSIGKNYIEMSKEVYTALEELKDFNYKNIYYKINTKEQLELYNKMFEELFDYYMNCLENNINCDIYFNYLDGMDKKYINNTSNARIVIDYIAGMTDNYIYKKYDENIKSKVKKF